MGIHILFEWNTYGFLFFIFLEKKICDAPRTNNNTLMDLCRKRRESPSVLIITRRVFIVIVIFLEMACHVGNTWDIMHTTHIFYKKIYFILSLSSSSSLREEKKEENENGWLFLYIFLFQRARLLFHKCMCELDQNESVKRGASFFLFFSLTLYVCVCVSSLIF